MRRRPVVLLLAFAAALTACAGTHPASQKTPSPSATHSSKSPRAQPKPTVHRSPAATGLLTNASISRATCGSSGRLVTFRIGVERDLATTPTDFGNGVRAVLCDARSWIASAAVRFRYDPNGSLLIGLRSPEGTEGRCMQLIGLSVERTYSCGTPHEVVLNSDRWFYGSPHWPGPVAEYREMLTNHETGHALGLYHASCPKDGASAPVMMQQSKGLTSPDNNNTCGRNPWPLEEELERLS